MGVGLGVGVGDEDIRKAYGGRQATSGRYDTLVVYGRRYDIYRHPVEVDWGGKIRVAERTRRDEIRYVVVKIRRENDRIDHHHHHHHHHHLGRRRRKGRRATRHGGRRR